jgi:4-amino-4-deoxy-L-arabinose transferase-like glycosyltransferase
MVPIAQPEVVEHPTQSRARVLAAAAVFLLAAAGQLALERTRPGGGLLSFGIAAVAFAAAGGIAIGLFRKSDLLPGPSRPLELPRFHPALYAACLPGAATLGLASWFHVVASPADARPAKLWILGVGLLLLPGLWDWYRNASQKVAGTGPTGLHSPRFMTASRDRRRVAAAAIALFAFAFAVRIWGGIDRMPGWIDSDEGATGVDGRAAFAEGPGALFGYWDMGSPGMTLFVSQLAAKPFGEGLRALRLGSALLGSLTVVLLFDFGRRLVGARAAFLAALLLAVNHAFVHYSRVGHTYIDTPFFASLALALLLRVVTGGSFLALTGAGIALSIGASTYIATEILPALVLLALVGWGITFHWPAKRVLPLVGFLAAVVVLMCAPMAASILRITPEIAYQRIPAISVLRPDGLAQLTDAYQAGSAREAIGEHVLRTLGVFNFGADHFKAYGATRPLNDAVTAALVPVAYVLLFSRLSSPLGWLSIVFTGAYLTGGVLICASQPTYHRISVVLLFSSLGIAWTLIGLARALAADVGVRRFLPAATVVAVVVASAWLNLHFYFRELPQIRSTEAGLGVGRLICHYAPTHTVIDATVLDGHAYARTENQYLDLQCPGAMRLRVDTVSRLWDFPDLTNAAARVVLIVPTVVESTNPGRPRGYRLVRRSVDTSIQSPAEVSLSVLEFERVPERLRAISAIRSSRMPADEASSSSARR